MRIGIDARWLKRNPTGIGVYLYEILMSLLEIDYKNEYYLFSPRSIIFPLKYKNMILCCDKGLWKNIPGTLWLNTRGKNKIINDKIDIFWGTSYVLPSGLPGSIKKILTIHDCSFVKYPETLTFYNRTVLNTLMKKSLKSADIIVTVSKEIKEDIIDLFKIKKKIKVNYNGINKKDFCAISKTKAKKFLEKKYHIKNDFILSLSTLEPRKNLIVLLKAYQQIQYKKDLILVGKKGWKYRNIFKYIKKSQLANRIKIPGYIEREDLKYFYSAADCFINPSIYEGFGMPNIEALACSCKVIVSDIPVFHEILGAHVYYFNNTISGLVKVIHTCLKNPNPCKINIAKKYSWKKSAKNMLKIFKEVCH